MSPFVFGCWWCWCWCMVSSWCWWWLVGGGAGAWWFYIAVAIAPARHISKQYIIMGASNISISSTFKASLMDFYYNIFSFVYHASMTLYIAFSTTVTYNYIVFIQLVLWHTCKIVINMFFNCNIVIA